jgi:Arc/MetJ family transcription regulator
MRINIEVDDELMRRAKSLTGAKNKREVIETALALLVQSREHENALKRHGHMTWDDDFDEG